MYISVHESFVCRAVPAIFPVNCVQTLCAAPNDSSIMLDSDTKPFSVISRALTVVMVCKSLFITIIHPQGILQRQQSLKGLKLYACTSGETPNFRCIIVINFARNP